MIHSRLGTSYMMHLIIQIQQSVKIQLAMPLIFDITLHCMDIRK